VDARADIYAMGIVLYTLLAGRDPFQHAQRLGDLLRAHAAELPEPPSRHAPWPIPAALDRAVLRALEKDPDRRFASAAGFAAELGRVAAASRPDEPMAAAPPPRWPVTERLDPGVCPSPAAVGKAACAPEPVPSRAGSLRVVLLGLMLAGALLLGFALAVLLRSGG
jgi:serine/threonine protein kinase